MFIRKTNREQLIPMIGSALFPGILPNQMSLCKNLPLKKAVFTIFIPPRKWPGFWSSAELRLAKYRTAFGQVPNWGLPGIEINVLILAAYFDIRWE
jgi:hypothetical protein